MTCFVPRPCTPRPSRIVRLVSAAAVAVVLATAACGGIVEEAETDDTAATDASVATTSTVGEAAVGSACTSDSSCKGTSDASQLSCMEIHDNIPFPSGYCSQTCLADSDCPSGSFCGVSGYDLGELARCMQPCGSGGSACRADYTCLQVTDISKAPAYGCWTVPTR